MNHMESNQLFTKGQHGFRKGRSCITQLIEVMEDWTEHLDNHNSVDAIYLDFQKAFDTVPHHRLITTYAWDIFFGFCFWLYKFPEYLVIFFHICCDWAFIFIYCLSYMVVCGSFCFIIIALIQWTFTVFKFKITAKWSI
jgi:hypothetical protein